MNEVIEALSGTFKELRSDCGGREKYIRSDECDKAERDMNKAEKAFDECREKLQETDRKNLAAYLDAMAHYHFEEEQRAYLQGMADAILLLDGLGLLHHSVRVSDILDSMKR